ncbi:MAG: AIR synthase-related protein, partial [bacterium]
AKVMQEFGVRSATDITGFGLLGHALKLAKASDVSMKIYGKKLPMLEKVYELLEGGCIPCAVHKNLEFAQGETEFAQGLDYNYKNLVLDAQTSGGILMSVPAAKVDQIIERLKNESYSQTSVIGEVIKADIKRIYVS